MYKQLKKYITIDKDILGGTPVISGTRIPVERLEFLIESGYDLDQLKAEYPQVNMDKVHMLFANLLRIGRFTFEQEYKSKKEIKTAK